MGERSERRKVRHRASGRGTRAAAGARLRTTRTGPAGSACRSDLGQTPGEGDARSKGLTVAVSGVLLACLASSLCGSSLRRLLLLGGAAAREAACTRALSRAGTCGLMPMTWDGTGPWL